MNTDHLDIIKTTNGGNTLYLRNGIVLDVIKRRSWDVGPYVIVSPTRIMITEDRLQVTDKMISLHQIDARHIKDIQQKTSCVWDINEVRLQDKNIYIPDVENSNIHANILIIDVLSTTADDASRTFIYLQKWLSTLVFKAGTNTTTYAIHDGDNLIDIYMTILRHFGD